MSNTVTYQELWFLVCFSPETGKLLLLLLGVLISREETRAQWFDYVSKFIQQPFIHTGRSSSDLAKVIR